MKRKELRKEQALSYVEQHRMLSDIAEVEREQVLCIIESALLYDGTTNRWQEYERLKGYASSIAGWHARHPELKTSGHYDVMIGFVDWLLQQSEPSELDGPDERSIAG